MINEEIISKWLEHKAESTVYSYNKAVGDFLDFVNNRQIRYISIGEIQDYVEIIKNKDDFSEAYKYSIITSLRSFFNFAFKEGIIPKDISNLIELNALIYNEKELLSLEEINNMFIKAKKDYYRDYVLISLIYFCGLKVKQLTEMTWNDLENIPVELHEIVLPLKKSSQSNKDKIFGINRVSIWKRLKIYNEKASPEVLKNSFDEHSRQLVIKYFENREKIIDLYINYI